MGWQIRWLSLVAVMTAVAIATAQSVSPAPQPAYIVFSDYFEASCPEGCRDVDKYTTCGAVSNCDFCNMTVDGDVTLSCMDGTIYVYSSRGGCTQGFNSSAWNAYLDQRFELRTVEKFMYIFEKFYSSFNYLGDKPRFITVSVLEAIVALFLLTLSVRLEKITRIVCGLLVGELIAIVILAMFNVTLDNFAKGIPLWVLPVVLALVAAVWRRVIAFLCGFGTGFACGCIMSAEVYQRSGKPIDKNIFYIVAALTAFFTVIAQPSKGLTLLLFVSIMAGLCATAAFIQLAGEFVVDSQCNSMAVAIVSCDSFVTEVIFGVVSVTAFASQICCIKHQKRKMAEAALAEAQPLVNGSQVSMPAINTSNINIGGIYGTV